MKCPICGHKEAFDARYCSDCGYIFHPDHAAYLNAAHSDASCDYHQKNQKKQKKDSRPTKKRGSKKKLAIILFALLFILFANLTPLIRDSTTQVRIPEYEEEIYFPNPTFYEGEEISGTNLLDFADMNELIYTDSSCALIITAITEDENGYTFHIEVDNFSDVPIAIVTESIALNGQALDLYDVSFYLAVDALSYSGDVLYVPKQADSGVTTEELAYTDLIFSGYDLIDYQDIYQSPQIHLTTTSQEDIVLPAAREPISEIFLEDDISVCYLSGDANEYTFEIRNASEEAILLDLTSLFLDEQMPDEELLYPYYSMAIPAGCRKVLTFSPFLLLGEAHRLSTITFDLYYLSPLSSEEWLYYEGLEFSL